MERFKMPHEHGPHTCYCPTCGFEEEVDAYTRCSSKSCPVCGSRMRAKETGEYRVSARIGNGGGANFAWFLVPVLGVGLLLAFMGLSKKKV
jgi:hypothetical protein